MKQQISLLLDDELRNRIDSAAGEDFLSRAEYIRRAIVEKLQASARAKQLQPSVTEVKDGLNIMMTDRQLEEVYDAVRVERNRRSVRRSLQGRRNLLS